MKQATLAVLLVLFATLLLLTTTGCGNDNMSVSEAAEQLAKSTGLKCDDISTISPGTSTAAAVQTSRSTTTTEATTTTTTAKPTTTEATTTTTTAKPTTTTAKPQPLLTRSQENALRSAKDYLAFTAFSRKGLIEQLEYEGYSNADATFAVDKLNVDWKAQAAIAAEQYLDLTSFSRSGLIDQLIYEGYTRAQAEYGVSQTGL
jgi:hypothetical protein